LDVFQPFLNIVCILSFKIPRNPPKPA
jgi:hypothetical protein